MEETMLKGLRTVSRCLAVVLTIALAMACSRAPKPAAESKQGAKKIPAGQEFSGFLKDYSALKPNPKLEGNALTYASPDAQKNLRAYFAIVVDPIEVYIATDADESKLPDTSRRTLANYFHYALVKAVSEAFPVVDAPGPLVLRLRAALIGVDVGGEVAAGDVPAETSKPLERAVNIGKVGVEMELIDSQTGDRIAAMVDKSNLGAGAEVGAVNFSRMQKFAAAKEAFDEWASRVRQFLDAEHELTGEDAARADKAYQPYGAESPVEPAKSK
jgi:Protein of unknown function (DUF3313)